MLPSPLKSYTHLHTSSSRLHRLLRLRGTQIRDLTLPRAPESPLLQHILDKRFTRFVTRAHERPGGAVQKAEVEGALAPELELVGGDVFVDGHVALGRAHVLAEGYDVDVVCAEF